MGKTGLKSINKLIPGARKLAFPILAAGTALATTAFLLFINDVNISLRHDELKTRLLEMDRTERNIDHIGLIATYDIHKKIYENHYSQENADAVEHKVLSRIGMGDDVAPAVPRAASILSVPALWIINANRMALGKTPLNRESGRDRFRLDLDLAFYYQRNFIFKKAIELYDKALADREIERPLRASILLHQGYCYALAGYIDRARDNYSEIIRSYQHDRSAITATVLLMYLEGFKTAREHVIKSVADPLLRSQKLVNLLAYQQALDALDAAESSAKPGDLPIIKYYKARSYSGLGRTAKAVETHMSIITDHPNSEYAKMSNRRLFIMGTQAGGDNDLKKISVLMNDRLKDPVLSSMIADKSGSPMGGPETGDQTMAAVPREFMKKAEKFAREIPRAADGPEILIIETSDGNIFRGVVIEKTESYIAIQTSIGRIDVKKDRITMISPVK